MRKEQDKNQSNLEEKKTKNKNSKKMFGGGYRLLTKSALPKVILLVIVIAILVATMFSAFNNKPYDLNQAVDPELARAMQYPQVQDGEEKVKIDREKYPDADEYENDIYPYIEFDACFLRDIDKDGIGEKIRGTCKEIGEGDTLYIEIKVQDNGYLEEGATITLNDDRNYYFETATVKDNQVSDNYIGNNIGEIKLKRIDNGVQKLLTGIVKSGDYTYDSTRKNAIGNDISNYSKKNTITLKGTHVKTNEDGSTKKQEIEKTVSFDVDWYGEAECKIININQINDNLLTAIDRTNGEFNLEFNIDLSEQKNELNLKKSEIKAQIPTLNEYEPKRVIVTNNDVTYKYEESTKVLTAYSEGSIREESEEKIEEQNEEANKVKKIVTSYPTNNYTVKVTYPIEAYDAIGVDTVEIKVPVEAKYEAYNNENTEFKNPYITNTDEATLVINYKKRVTQEETYSADFDVQVGKYVTHPTRRYIVSKEKPLKIYNELSESEINDTYEVRWYGYTGNKAPEGVKMTFKDAKKEEANKSDQFIKTGEEDSMEDISTTVGIYFSDPTELLGNEGEIKVYDDETGMLLQTFNKDNWGVYSSSSSAYKFEVGVRHIRIETSNVNNDSSIKIYLIKEINDDAILQKYTREEFDKLEYIKSTLSGYLGDEYITTDSHEAHYEAPISEVELKANVVEMSTQVTQKNEIFTISATYNENSNEIKWTNGVFLLKMPKEIIDLKINDVSVENNSNVEIVSYEQYKKTEQNEEENEEYIFVKIITENATEQFFNINVNCDITPDPRISTTNKEVMLYAYNEQGEDYSTNIADKYDINNNALTEDIIGSTSLNLAIISPQSLITAQTAKEYDETGNIAVAPQIANISKEQTDATLDITVLNNYSGDISEVKIIGKIPTTGNSYVINGAKLGSNFDTELVEGSINIPEGLRDNATIYYSEKENPNKDLINDETEWTQHPENYSKIKTFLIDFGNYIFTKGKEEHITYKIKMQQGLQYNQVSYAHHAVYFSLETENGKYRTNIEPNKIGFRVSKLYDLELTKYQKGMQKKIQGATYYLWEDGSEEGKTQVTNKDGKLILSGLYVDAEYNIKEIKTPKEYALNEEVIKFVAKEDGEFSVERKDEGESRRLIATTDSEGKHKVELDVEDEVNANIEITKLEKQEEVVPIRAVRFKLTGKGLPETGRVITTNNEGKVSIKGLEIEQEYTLEEVKAEGYYLASPIKFKIVHEQDNYNINIINLESEEDKSEEVDGMQKVDETAEETVHTEITVESEIPTAKITIKNEKIPTYNLTIKKVEKGNESKVVVGAQFRLLKDGKEIGRYTIGGDGTVTIPNLYAYEESKNVEQSYILEEIYVPEGYSKVKNIGFKVTKSESGEYSLENTEGTIAKTQVDVNNITITVEDNTSFKLTKQDAVTEALLPNTKFVIYNVDDETVPARNSKGELVGEKQIIDGKEYNVLTTDREGKITVDLPQGLYKAVEVQASEEKYKLADETYFGIGESSKNGKIGKITDIILEGQENYSIESVATTIDGGYIAGGYFYSENINLGKNLEGTDEVLENSGSTRYGSYYEDAMLIKYNDEGVIEWTKSFGASDGSDIICVVLQTLDDGYIVGGYFSSISINLGESIINNEPIILTNYSSDTYYSYSNGMIIKYDKDGNLEWAKQTNDKDQFEFRSIIECSDEGYIVKKQHDYSDYYGDTQHQYKAIYKYDKNGNLDWSKDIDAEDYLTIEEDNNKNYIITGSFRMDTNIGQDINGHDVILEPDGDYYNSYSNYIVKCNEDGKIVWVKNIGQGYSDKITSSIIAKDGCYVFGMSISANSNLGKDENEETVTLSEDGNILIKYGEDGKIKWLKKSDIYIATIKQTADDGYIIAGGNGRAIVTKYSKDLEIEWETQLYDIQGGKYNNAYAMFETDDRNYIINGFKPNTFYNNIQYIAEINRNGQIQYIQDLNTNEDKNIIQINENEYIILGSIKKLDIVDTIGQKVKFEQTIRDKNKEGYDGFNNPTTAINSIIKTGDGGYIVAGYAKDFVNGHDIDLGKDVIMNPGGIILKYDKNNELEWSKNIGVNNAVINSLIQTKDNGYIVGGYFENSTIELDDGNQMVNYGEKDGMIIKYNDEGKMEWYKTIGGKSNEEITSICETVDGGYIIDGTFESDTIQLDAINTLKNTSTGINSYISKMIIKYNKLGNIEWTKTIGDVKDGSVIATSDGGFLVTGISSNYAINLGNDINGEKVVLTNGGELIIKYNKDGILEWAKNINISSSSIGTIIETSDGDYAIEVYINDYQSNHYDINLGKNKEGKDVIIDIIDCSYPTIIIKYSPNGYVEFVKAEKAISIMKSNDGGFLIKGDGYLEKYNDKNLLEWTKNISGSFIKESQNGDYIVVNGNQEICRYSKEGELKWKVYIGKIGLNITGILEKSDKEYIIIGELVDYISSYTHETVRYNNINCAILMNVEIQDRILEQQEVLVKNEVKKFKITTEVETVDGEKGGTILGEESIPYETVEYDQSNQSPITMTPYEGYEIVKVTVNDEIQEFTVNGEDKSYTLPTLEHITEDKHVVVTFAKTENKFVLKKFDEDGITPLAGAKFRIEHIEEQGKIPTSVINEINDNGQEYTLRDKEKNITGNVAGKIVGNGQEYVYTDKAAEITQNVKGEIKRNGKEYSVGNAEGKVEGKLGEKQDGETGYSFVYNEELQAYEPTNGRTYIREHELGTKGIPSSTAHSYFEINLQEYTGKDVVVVINARGSSSYGDEGYAIITNSTEMPEIQSNNSEENGQFMRIYSTYNKENRDYTSMALSGGNTYYLHLMYKKDSGGDGEEDRVIINSIGIYEAGIESYYFEDTEGNGVYKSNNKERKDTLASSYIPIDLRQIPETEHVSLVIEAEISCIGTSGKEGISGSAGFAKVTTTEDRVEFSNSDYSYLIRITGKEENKEYETKLEGGKLYYLHLGYYNIREKDEIDTFTINSVKVYKTKTVTYDFGEQEPYVPSNKGIEGTTASAYIPINLTDYADKKIAVVVNAEMSTEYSGNYGYAIISNTTDRVEHYTNGADQQKFIDISGKKEAQDYTIIIDGGKEYYLHLGYDKSSRDTTEEEKPFTVNSVNVYEVKTQAFNFRTEEIDETSKRYISTNEGEANTQANSYVKIDLQGYEGKYNVIVNAEISSGVGDYGYAILTTSPDRANYNDYNGTSVIYQITGEMPAVDYTAVVEGDKEYYLHFGYYKDEKGDGGKDQFIINNIEVVPNKDHLYKVETVTDKNGEAILNLPLEPTARYSITEIEAPEGYELAPAQVYEMKTGEPNEVTITNKKKPKLIVHHYKKETGINDVPAVRVSPDEEYYGTMGEEYETKPKLNLEQFELEKGEDGKYITPINAKGIYKWPDEIREEERKGQLVIEVTYYYTEKKVPLTVHHYIEGTITKVPLENGETATDKIIYGEDGAEYRTEPLKEKASENINPEETEYLSERYELVGMPSNANGRFAYPEVEVTYEYRLKTYDVTTRVNMHTEKNLAGEDIQVAGGTILGEGERPYETVEHGQANEKPIVITPKEGYEVKSITINQEEIGSEKYVEENGIITLNAIPNITEDQEIVVEFQKIQGEVRVNHYIYDPKATDPYTNQHVTRNDGTEVAEQVITGAVGDMYVTKALENLAKTYEFFEEPTNSSGLIEKEPKYVNYYYKTKEATITDNIIKDGSDKITSKDEEIHYKIKYTVQIDNYTGKAEVTITDKLPYYLDEEKTNAIENALDSGTYSKENKTITWTQTINSIDTITEGKPKEIVIEKEITVIFENVDVKQENIMNTVEGSIFLEGTEQTKKTETTYTTQAEYIKTVKVTKTWEHGANTYQKPSGIKIKLINPKAEDQLPVEEVILNEENNWTHIFTNLPKYDEKTGEEINYEVEEHEIEGEEEIFKYYEKK